MADTKISDLAAVTDVVSTDEYVLARTGGSKKITAANLADGLCVVSSYTPTVTASGSNPTNYAATGRYTKVGKLVTGWARIAWGATSTFGSGAFDVSLPFTASASEAFRLCGLAVGSDASPAATYFGEVLLGGANGTAVEVYVGANPVGNTWSATVPITWADNDFFVVSFTYEAA